jgi:hypothetical protein
MSDDLWWFFSDSDESNEASPRAGLPFFEPTPPESFEEELEGIEFDNLDDNVQFPTQLDGPFPTYPDTFTPSLSASSESAYSADLTEDTGNSEYSTSNYSSPFDMFADVDFGSEYNAVDPKHISVFSADSSTFFDSFGIPQLSAATFFQDVQVGKAQVDDGPYRPPIGISPDLLSSGAFHGPTPAVPTNPPVGVGSAIPSHTGPMRTKFVCSYCGHGKYSFYFVSFLRLNVSF